VGFSTETSGGPFPFQGWPPGANQKPTASRFRIGTMRDAICLLSADFVCLAIGRYFFRTTGARS
jgi:hypothetical protein